MVFLLNLEKNSRTNQYDKKFNTWTGINIETGNAINFKEAGIIDPTKVTRLALENAASIAGTVLLTEYTITEDKSEDAQTPAAPAMPAGMEGMY